MTEPLRVAVLGAGNWGTTLAQLIARNGHAPRLFTRDAALCDQINHEHENPRSLRGVSLDPGLRATTQLSAAVADADLVLLVLPSRALRATCRELAALLSPEQLVVHGIKGLEPESHARMSQIIQEETCARQIGVLAGPNIAAEVAVGKPAGTVIATRFPALAERVRRALECQQLRVFDSRDVTGVELCGALKNVVAIAAGMIDELELGDNAKAFLVTRGMAEVMRLAFALGAEPATVAGLAGVGDLMVTCASPLSRNHRVGVALAQGVPLSEAVARLGMVAEGVYACRSARALAEAHDIEMPLFAQIDRILHEGVAVPDAIGALMQMPTGRDVPGVIARRPRPTH
jgi:glycerol-3-phosphate dehydrogenase (NAD(P)+)